MVLRLQGRLVDVNLRRTCASIKSYIVLFLPLKDDIIIICRLKRSKDNINLNNSTRLIIAAQF